MTTQEFKTKIEATVIAVRGVVGKRRGSVDRSIRALRKSLF